MAGSPSTLVCADCGTQFEFSADERQRFEARGFAPPKRCKICRDVKRRRQSGQNGAPGDGAAQRPAAARPDDARATTRHPATCTACGEPTEVPFVPDGKRPIYCLPCLKRHTR